eukprot:1157548-Pelagomonas_calceolata.AAC.4
MPPEAPGGEEGVLALGSARLCGCTGDVGCLGACGLMLAAAAAAVACCKGEEVGRGEEPTD